MRRREEKRRAFHEALLQTLYPPSSPSSLSSSPSPVEVVDEEPFDVTLINPEDYVKLESSNPGDVNENAEESGIGEKPSRAQRKRVRKKMLKEEAVRRKKIIGPLLPTEMFQTHAGSVADVAGGSNLEEDASCSQSVRSNAQEKEDEFDDNDKKNKVKKRRKAKKLAKESSKPIHPTPEISNQD